MRAIPTSYCGTQFRSRLEARWAATFDLLQWPWEYEPVDLDGYIPDFALLFYKPLMVEIKPALTLAELRTYTTKIDQADCPHEVLLLGATTRFPDSEDPRKRYATLVGGFPTFGLLRQSPPEGETNSDGSPGWWEEAVFFGCTLCQRDSLHHYWGWYGCRVNGCNDGNGHLGGASIDLDATWTTAGNAVQWKAVTR